MVVVHVHREGNDVERTVNALWDRIGVLLDAFAPGMRSCFRAAGYKPG